MTDEINEFLKQKNLSWKERISIGKGPVYLLEERNDNLIDNQYGKVAGWVQKNEGKYEAGIPGLPSAALFDKSINKENSAISLGLYDDVETAKLTVERHLPDESEWIYL